MYFQQNLPNSWNMKEAFNFYYDQHEKDLPKTNRAIKNDLIDLSTRPTVLQSVKKAAAKYLSRWEKLLPQFKQWADEYIDENTNLPETSTSSSSETSPEIQRLYNVTNINKDNATFNQTNTFITEQSTSDDIHNNNNKGKRKYTQSSERQFLFEKVNVDMYKEDTKTWIIDEEDIGKKFKAYQVAVAEKIQEKELYFETESHELLALSNIILIKPGQSSHLFDQYISTSTMSKIERKVQEKFNITENRFNPMKKAQLEDIIHELRDKKITIKVATKKITAMTSDEDDDVDELLFGVCNLIESIPASKFNYQVRESNLSCSYVHCVLNPIFNQPENNKHIMWLNNQIIKESDKQGTIFGAQLQGPGIIGEVKGEDRINDIHPCLLDMLRIGALSGESINENNYDGVIGVLVIGLQMTFFMTTLMAPGCYIMLEICSITLPKDFTQIRSYIAQMEDLLPLFQYYDSCTNKSGINEDHKRLMLDSSIFDIIASTGKDRKRLCNIFYRH